MSISEAFKINYSDKIISLNGNGDIECLDKNHYKRVLLVEKLERSKQYAITALYDYIKETLRNEIHQTPFTTTEINDDFI